MKKNCRKTKKTVFLFGFFLSFIHFGVPTLLFAQEFPTKPVNILVSFAPGLTIDLSIRLLTSAAQKFLGQPFVISNNGGGGGSVALGIIAKERPDGYHLVGCTSIGLIWIPQFRAAPYRHEDFIPIMHYGTTTTGIVVRADSPWKTLKEFVEYAKKNPGKVTYTSTGTTGTAHVAMEYIAKQEGGIQWSGIPYSGGDPDIPLLGGHVSACSAGASWIPHVKAGSLRLLAIHGERRMKLFSEVPTLRESGYDYAIDALFMLAAPKGTPLPIVKKLDDAFQKAMDDPDFIRYMEKAGIDISYRNHEDTKKSLEEAYVRLGKVIAELKLPKEPEKK